MRRFPLTAAEKATLLYAKSWKPCAEPTQNLRRDRVRLFRKVIDRDLGIVVFADQYDNITRMNGADVRHIDHHLVHADASYDGSVMTMDQYIAPAIG